MTNSEKDLIKTKALDFNKVKQSFKDFLYTKEYVKRVYTEEEILAQQQQQLEKDNKDQEDKSTDKSISNTLSAKEKANLIVGP